MGENMGNIPLAREKLTTGDSRKHLEIKIGRSLKVCKPRV